MERIPILIIGSGGREHALAWKLAQSPLVGELFIAPGNAGTALVGTNVPIRVDDVAGLVTFAREKGVGLTAVGPEIPLALGLVDAFQAAGLPVFGPTQAAAQLEASKAFAKQFMQEEGVPTAVSATFTDYHQAANYLPDGPSVIKASGLAAGKGVIVCDNRVQAEAALRQIMLDREFGAAGDEVVIEERLTGPELSVLAFCDGKTAVALAPARDHKRAYDGDLGPNTGGMGVYAPPPDVDDRLVEEIMRTVIQPAVDGMARRGTPYIGVLYAGVMLTPDGPKTLEFNCRFGDPETQVILPLLDGDLAEIMLACSEGRLTTEMVRVYPGACATVVMAAPGYPGSYRKGLPISGLGNVPEDVLLFHAGTKAQDGQIVSDGGRVLCVSGRGADLGTAVARAYASVAAIHFEGAHFRKDIGGGAGGRGSRGEISPAPPLPRPSAYAAAGVDIAAGQRATELMKTAVHATFGPEVLSNVGSFGGLFDISKLKELAAPILVASTDGVGTKTMVAAQMGRWDTIGQDIVNHCANDILVQGATPLFFLDYVASSKLNPEQIAAVVAGAAAACRALGCALLGGETAEMPGVYQPGELDLVGTIVGVVDRERLIDGSHIQAGDVILGLHSSGLHTNGYTLARAALSGLDWHEPRADLDGSTIGEALLAVHRPYLREIQTLWQAGITVRGLAHITGGGLIDNPPRIFPKGLGATLRRGSWPEPPIFSLIQRMGEIAEAEMFHVFNMGLGMLVIVPAEQAERAGRALAGELFAVGEMSADVAGVALA
jgi:phosphoribosylamine--glycine ligase / phosphoribosylformylglycinamidine cyclo-ligase